ncbi:MAG: ABC transporter ATP-binding protein [Candidatus Berkelbacteria bacterium]|nr:ABC transporter ATP-binding protein [Candidatus Berkelbacteria bacterium]
MKLIYFSENSVKKNNMSVIEIKNLKKHFGAVKAVDGISLSIEKGEIFGFLGPNGAGKTTTIRTMMDFIRPTAGEIKIVGLDAKENSVELKEKIGYLSDSARFYDHWNVKKHFDFQQSLRGKSKNLNDLIKLFGLTSRQNFSNLSSGNKRKLSIILALMNNPEVLILDEPTSSLDPILQNAFHNYLENFAASGGTVFMSSHNLSEVEKICDRVGIIKDGKMVATERISEMKLMKMYSVNFHAEKVDEKIFADKNVEIINNIGGMISLKVKGDINPTIQKLAKIKVRDLEITHASLEDIFLEFYS